MPVRLDGTTSDFLEMTSTGIWSPASYTVIFWMQVVTANAGVDRQFFTLADVTTDFFGNPRPATRNDIGAHQAS